MEKMRMVVWIVGADYERGKRKGERRRGTGYEGEWGLDCWREGKGRMR